MENERPIIVTEIDGTLIKEYPSIKKATYDLFAGTGVGRSLLYNLGTGVQKKSFCAKLNRYIKAKYKY